MSKYIIRSMAFQYSDEFLFAIGEGGIHEVFEDKEQAEKKFKAVEIESLRKQMLSDIEQFSPCNSGYEDMHVVLNDYFIKNFNIPLITEGADFKGIQSDFYIPSFATDEQVWEIKQICKIAFYTLVEFKDNCTFYALVRNGNSTFPPYFYNTKEEVLKTKVALVFTGSMSDISDTPEILENVIMSNNYCVYSSDEMKLKISVPRDDENGIMEILGIISLIKKDLIDIIPISLEEAQKVERWQFEEM